MGQFLVLGVVFRTLLCVNGWKRRTRLVKSWGMWIHMDESLETEMKPLDLSAACLHWC